MIKVNSKQFCKILFQNEVDRRTLLTSVVFWKVLRLIISQEY